MTAHLDDESRYAGIPELAPTLVRWAPEPDAPPHLSVGLDRLRAATRAETLLVVSGQLAPAELLERVHDVRRAGATVFALDQEDPELDGLAHESLPVSPVTAPVSFDAAQHLVSSAVAGDGGPAAAGLPSDSGEPELPAGASRTATRPPGQAPRHGQRHTGRLAWSALVAARLPLTRRPADPALPDPALGPCPRRSRPRRRG